MPHKFSLYPHTRTGFNMVLPPAAYMSESFDWKKREEEFKAQLAAVGVIENRDYVQDNSEMFRKDSRPFVVNGIARKVYVLLKVPQDMIEMPLFIKRTDGRETIFAMDAAKLATEITPADCRPGDGMYLQTADDFLCSILQTCVNMHIHKKFLSTTVTRQLNADLTNIMQMPHGSFFERPKYKLAYCSLYHALCSEKVAKTSRSGLLSVFFNTPLFNEYEKLMGYYTRDCAPNLRFMTPASMLEIYHTHVEPLNRANQASQVR